MTSSFLVDSGARFIHCNRGKVIALPCQRVYPGEQQYVGLKIKLDLKFFEFNFPEHCSDLLKCIRVAFSHSPLHAAFKYWLPFGTLKSKRKQNNTFSLFFLVLRGCMSVSTMFTGELCFLFPHSSSCWGQRLSVLPSVLGKQNNKEAAGSSQ